MKFICWLHWLDGNGVHARHPIGLAQVMLALTDAATPRAAAVAGHQQRLVRRPGEALTMRSSGLNRLRQDPRQRRFVAIGGKTEARAVDGRVDDQQAPPIRP